MNVNEIIRENRTAAIVDLQRLAHNAESVAQKISPSCRIMAVLKGDAYGHGITPVVKKLSSLGIDHFAAAIWEEGVAIRQAGICDPVLILGDTCSAHLTDMVSNDLTNTIFSRSRCVGAIKVLPIYLFFTIPEA